MRSAASVLRSAQIRAGQGNVLSPGCNPRESGSFERLRLEAGPPSFGHAPDRSDHPCRRLQTELMDSLDWGPSDGRASMRTMRGSLLHHSLCRTLFPTFALGRNARSEPYRAKGRYKELPGTSLAFASMQHPPASRSLILRRLRACLDW